MDLSDVSIIPLLPPNLAKDRNVRSMCEAFDSELRRLIAGIPGIEIIPNLARKKITDNLLLDLLAWQFHCDFYSPDLPIEIKQELVLKSLDWHTRKGTPSVVEQIVSTVFSKAMIQEWFEYNGLPYRFRIGIDEEPPDEATRANLYRAINSVKNARSFLDKITSLIFFEDQFNVTDYVMIIVNTNASDRFGSPIKFNGAVKFDGKTANSKITVKGKFNGRFKFNGDLSFRGIAVVPAPYQPKPPFKFSSRILDGLDVMVRRDDPVDNLEIDEGVFIGIRKHHTFNGACKFNGAIQFDSTALIPWE